MNRRQLAEAFAKAMRPPYGRASNLWYDGDTAYSYATPIAKKLPWAYEGQRVVWITNRKYSQSTTVQANALLCAFLNSHSRILRSEKAPENREEMVHLIKKE